MEQTEFLEKKIFIDLENLNTAEDKETVYHFSEADFEKVLELAEYNGIGIYTVESIENGETKELANHEDFRKKATDSLWYKKAFLTFKTRNPGLVYKATYKVSAKLLAK